MCIAIVVWARRKKGVDVLTCQFHEPQASCVAIGKDTTYLELGEEYV